MAQNRSVISEGVTDVSSIIFLHQLFNCLLSRFRPPEMDEGDVDGVWVERAAVDLLGHVELRAALFHIDRAGDLVGDDGYGANHLADKVGASDGIALRLIKQESGFELYKVGLVLLQVAFELLV